MTQPKPIPSLLRRKFLIDKKLQLGYARWFLALTAAASGLSMVLFFFGTHDTLTMNYDGVELQVLNTFRFFLPIALVTMLTVLLLTSILGIAGLVFYSHRIAGPLFRFRVVLDHLRRGDLTYRFKLRSGDQLGDVADSLNTLTQDLDERIGTLQTASAELARLAEELRRNAGTASQEQNLHDITKKLAELQDEVNYFKTYRNS